MKSRILMTCGLVAALALTACGDLSEDSKEAQAEEFYDEALNLTKQKECNDQGFVYDNINGGDSCSTLPLAEFDCSYATIRARVAGKTNADTFEAKLNELEEDEFETAQCGYATKDSFEFYAVVFHYKAIEGDSARARATIASFIIAGEFIWPGGGDLNIDPDEEPDTSGEGTDTTDGTDSTDGNLPECNLINDNCGNGSGGEFLALHFVKQGGTFVDWVPSLAVYTGKNADLDNLVPLPKAEANYPRNVVRDGDGKLWTHTTHDFGYVDDVTGQVEIVNTDTSWPISMTYVASKDEVWIGGRSAVYRYSVAAGTMTEDEAMSFDGPAAMAYDDSNNRIYMLHSVYDGNTSTESITKIDEVNDSGALVQSTDLSEALSYGGISSGGSEERLQMKLVNGQLILLVHGDENKAYSINPADGVVTEL